jgi:hypothetical protein
MKAQMIIVAFLIASLPMIGCGRDQNDSATLFAVGSDSSARLTWSVRHDRLDSQSLWAPEDGPPPLGIAKACELGATWLKRKHPEIQNFEVERVTLQSYMHIQGKRGAVWYYNIDYNAVVGGQTLALRHDIGAFTAVVLFDGFVVEPTQAK